MSLPVLLNWPVPKEFKISDGYRHVPSIHSPPIGPENPDGELSKRELLVANSIDHSEYKLSDHPALFLTFAKTEQTRDGILAFASKYGFIEESKSLAHYYETIEGAKKNNGAERINDRELVEDWIREIRYMNQVVELWLNLDAESKKYVRWEGYDKVYYDVPNSEPHLIASKEKNSELLESLRPGDHLGPGQSHLLTRINDYIRHAYPIMWIVDNKMQPCIQPKSLLNGMWYQLADAVAEDRKYKACEYCGTYFELGVGKAPLTKKYCSDRCRVAANRKKHA
ncbi:MAG: hypothetical protein AB2563_03575 [Candidatus Thiodiazotropha endolucinida]